MRYWASFTRERDVAEAAIRTKIKVSLFLQQVIYAKAGFKLKKKVEVGMSTSGLLQQLVHNKQHFFTVNWKWDDASWLFTKSICHVLVFPSQHKQLFKSFPKSGGACCSLNADGWQPCITSLPGQQSLDWELSPQTSDTVKKRMGGMEWPIGNPADSKVLISVVLHEVGNLVPGVGCMVVCGRSSEWR